MTVVVITGASSGIGAETAEVLARRGMSVVLVARRKEALDEVAARCAGLAHAIVADVTVRTDVRRVVDETLARFGVIDVWINNVGQGITRPPSQLTDEDVDEIMRVNVKSALYGMQEVLPHFRSRDAGQVIKVSPGVVRTDFGLNARHGGPDSRQLPDSQEVGEVAVVIADVIASREPDVYTRAGAQARVAGYYASAGIDPPPETHG